MNEEMHYNRIGHVSFTINYGAARGCSMFRGHDRTCEMQRELGAMAASGNVAYADWAGIFNIYNNYDGKLFLLPNTGHRRDLLSCDEKKYIDAVNGMMLFFINFIKTIKNKWHIDVDIPTEISIFYYADDGLIRPLTIKGDIYV